ncbi:MAG: enoyl-CoA hydratase/isomerase family protein [Dictyoglomaceae bacterium]|nr:enoyl-CoA hydratase/isomerase family protein [Dictyoglomaceae bacterium]
MLRFIEIEERIPVLIIRLNRPEFQNKLNIEMMEEIISNLDIADKNPNIKVIVLSSKGKVFCAGGDLGNYKKISELRTFGETFIKLHIKILKLNKPVICSVEGGAFGGGLSLINVCDIAIASQKATFGFPEIKSDLAPMMSLAGTGRSLNKKIINELALTGREISAEEAKSLGIINQIEKEGKVEETAINLAFEISKKNSTAISFYKYLYRYVYEKDLEERMERGLDVLINLLKEKEESNTK